MAEADTSFADTSFADDPYADELVMPPPVAVSMGAQVPRTVSGAQLARDRDSADNPTPQLVPPPTHAVAGTIGEKHVLVMVRPRALARTARALTLRNAAPALANLLR
jgi:hypothetical protein